MIKTQIQLPEELHGELKSLARRKQWSLAETLRRAGESLLQQYPEVSTATEDWTPPSNGQVGWKGLGPEALKEMAMEERGPSALIPGATE